MRVLMAPFFEDNQYLELLESSLVEQGVSVERSTTARPLALPLIDAIRSDPDVFHLHWTHPYFLFGSYERFYRIPFVKYACWLFAIVFLVQLYLITRLCDRVVWTVHNKCNHERRYEGMDRWVSKQVFSMVDAVQVWDEHTKQELAEYLDVETEKMTAVPHGNYLALYPPENRPSKSEARRDLNLPEDDRIFLYFGMIRPYKQVVQLLEVWDDTDPDDAQLVIAGNPKYDDLREAIETKAAQRDDVTIDLRYIPDQEVPTYFAASDITVFPYEHIFSSGSVVLAMSMGRAFVAPSKGAIPGINAGNNFVYTNHELKAALCQAIACDEIESVGRNNIEYVRLNHDWDKIGKELEKLYKP